MTAEVVALTRPARRLVGLALLLAGIVVVVCSSIALGSRDIPLGTVVEALTGRLAGDDYESLVIHRERIPRTVLGLLAGSSLGTSGLIMQGVTRNPLADPGVLGIEAGAGLAVIGGIVVFGIHGSHAYFWFALLGAIVTAALVWTVSQAASAVSSEVSLVIVGACAGGLIVSAITLFTVRDPAAYLRYRAWAVGLLSGNRDAIGDLWPFVAAGLAAALLLGGRLNALSLGDDVAAGLGTNVVRARLGCSLVAVVLCAAATAALGPVAFVGLVAAHLARLIVGSDFRWLLPYAAVCGGLVLLAADVLGRLAPGSGEVEVGVMTAFVGTPFFIALSRRSRRVEL